MRLLFLCREMTFSFSVFRSVLRCCNDYSLLALQVALLKVCLQNFQCILKKLPETMFQVCVFSGFFFSHKDTARFIHKSFQCLKLQILANKMQYFCKVNNLYNGWHVLCHGVKEIDSTRCSAVSQPPAAAFLTLHTQIAWKVFVVIGKVDFGVFQASQTKKRIWYFLLACIALELFGLSPFLKQMVSLEEKQQQQSSLFLFDILQNFF